MVAPRFGMVSARSRSRIEHYALRVVRYLFPDYVEELKAIPIAEFLEFDLETVHPRLKVEFGSLPSPAEAVTVPGVGTGHPTRIIFDQEVIKRMVNGDGRARFTGAHELYHGLVHAKELRQTLTDGPRIEGLFRAQNVPRYRCPEWQADVFAASFLMPEPATRAFLAVHGRDIPLMAKTAAVSQTAARIRIDRLGLK